MLRKLHFEIDNKTFAGFVFVLVVLFVIQWFTLRTTTGLIENTKLVNQTYTIITKLESVFSMLKDAESGQRGYIITNDSNYMGPYNKQRIEVQTEINELKELTIDNPEYQKKLATLDSLQKVKYENMEETLTLQQEAGQVAAIKSIMTGEENKIMIKIRNLIDKMKEDEYRILGQRTLEANDSSSRTLMVILITGLLALLIIIVSLYYINSDTIKRKKAEEELNRFFTLSLDMMCIIGNDGYFKRINPAFEDVLGYTNKELFSKPYYEFIYPDDKENTVEAVNNMVKDSTKLNIENRWICKDGSFKWLAWKSVPVGDVRYASARDITEQKLSAERIGKMNEELEMRVKKRTEQLKKSNEELQQFAYIASHDLQEPLRMVASYMQLLEKKYKGKLDEKADQYINFAVDGASRMKALINDLLDFSRLDTKAKPMQLSDFNEILDDVTHNLKVAIKESKTQIEIIGKMPSLIVDSTQIIQLFQNLINNAIKFRNQDITPIIKISAEEQPKQWVFKISDNGIGIEKEYYDRIFIIFQRLNNRVEYPGTGIGLAICKKIVERHGGQIWLESEVGKGSTFFFSIKK